MIKLTIKFNDPEKTVVSAAGHSVSLAVKNLVTKLVNSCENIFDDGEVLFGISEVIRTEQPYSYTCEQDEHNNFDIALSGKVEAPAIAPVVSAPAATPVAETPPAPLNPVVESTNEPMPEPTVLVTA